MSEIKTVLSAISQIDTYQRVSTEHPLDLYIGTDEMARWTLLLISDFQSVGVTSSKMIQVKTGKRSDNRWSLSFSLLDDTYKDMFVLFCDDIVLSSGCIRSKEKAVRFVENRYKEWREMLANAKGDLLSPEEIKGLLGEMYFLKEYLAKQYGINKAVFSWTGPKRLPQDFIMDNTWFEVKTISHSRTEVLISSIEQLDCTNTGQLVVLRADKTSTTNSNGTNLNKVYSEIMSAISDDHSKDFFSNLLLRYGYLPRSEYEDEEYTFEIEEIVQYRVDMNFPCIRKADLPACVTEAKYSISLAAISQYIKE